MIRDLLLSFASVLPQSPAGAADEAKARAELGRAAQHVDDVLVHAGQLREHAKAALELARSTEATANQIDRARLAKLAGDLAAQLATLEVAVKTHVDAIEALRAAATAELPPPAAGTVPWFRERMRAARKLASFDETVTVLRTIEGELVGEAKSRAELQPVLGHARYLLGDAIRETALQARSTSHDARAISLLRDASKKLEEALASPDSADTGEGSSLHAVALRRRVEIEGGLFLAFSALQQQQKSNDATTAKRHRDNAVKAFERLEKAFADATLPNGQRVVDATRASIERMKQNR